MDLFQLFALYAAIAFLVGSIGVISIVEAIFSAGNPKSATSTEQARDQIGRALYILLLGACWPVAAVGLFLMFSYGAAGIFLTGLSRVTDAPKKVADLRERVVGTFTRSPSAGDLTLVEAKGGELSEVP